MSIIELEERWKRQPQGFAKPAGQYAFSSLFSAAIAQPPQFTLSSVSRAAASGGIGLLSTGSSAQYALADLAGGALFSTAGLTLIVFCTPSSVATDSAPAGLVNRYTGATEPFSELGFRTSASATWQIMIRGTSGRVTQDTSLPAVANKPVCLVMSCTSASTQLVGVNGAVVSKTVSGYGPLALDALSICGIRRPVVGSNSYNFSGVVHGAVVLGRSLSAQEVAQVSANPWGLFEPRRIWVPVAAAGGGTGALSATLDGATSSAAGSLAIAGTTAITLAGASTAATGTLAITGTAAATLAGATSSATGALQIQATAAATLAGATLSAAGALVAEGSGTLAATLDGASAAAAGTLAIAGAAAATLSGATLAAEGTLTAPGTGTVFATLAGVSVSAAGHVDIAAALGVTLGDLVVTSTGTLAITGAAAATMAGATLAAVGSEDGAEAVPLAAPVFSRAAAVRTGLSDRSISAQARRIGRGNPG